MFKSFFKFLFLRDLDFKNIKCFKNQCNKFQLFFLFQFPCQRRKRLAYGFQALFIFVSIQSHAFLSDILEAKKQLEGASIALESLVDTIGEVEALTGIEGEYLVYEKELEEFQKTLNEYEELGLDVRDFVELRNYDPSTLRGQIDFFKNYLRRAKNILKSISSVIKSPEAITASEQIETNRTLRALLEDNQARELRKLRQEIAKQKTLLHRRKKEQEFINKQYAYINRHSKKKGFSVFHPFQNEKELKREKRKKFLGIF